MTGLAKLMQMQAAAKAGVKVPTQPAKDSEHVGLTTDNTQITSDVAEDGAPAKDSTLEGVEPAPARKRSPLAGLRVSTTHDHVAKSGSVPRAPDPVADDSPKVPEHIESVATPKTGVLGRLAAMRPAGPVEAEPSVEPSGDFSLDDLANFDATGVNEQAKSHVHFADEMPATAPTRELPADLDAQQKMFIESLDGIYHVLDDPEMFGNLIRSIMMELQDYPEYQKLIVDQDVHVMIRAMRNTMGLARVKKQESKAKRTGGAAATKKSGTKGVDASMLADLESLAGLGIEDE